MQLILSIDGFYKDFSLEMVALVEENGKIQPSTGK